MNTDDARLLRLPDLRPYAPYSDATIYRMMSDGEFPKPIKLGKGRTGAVAWIESEVKAWAREQIRKGMAERDKTTAA